MSNATKNMASDMPSFSDKFTIKLTARQQQILELIQNSIARTGSPPTRAEIATEFGFKSANASEEHLKALARKGAIELVSGPRAAFASKVTHCNPSTPHAQSSSRNSFRYLSLAFCNYR